MYKGNYKTISIETDKVSAKLALYLPGSIDRSVNIGYTVCTCDLKLQVIRKAWIRYERAVRHITG